MKKLEDFAVYSEDKTLLKAFEDKLKEFGLKSNSYISIPLWFD